MGCDDTCRIGALSLCIMRILRILVGHSPRISSSCDSLT